MDIFVKPSLAYLPYLKVLMVSVYENNKDVMEEEGITFWCLHNALEEIHQTELRSIAEIYHQLVEFIYVDVNIFSQLPSSGTWPKTIYFGLLVHQYLPKNKHRILYLDIDTVVNGNLREFYNLPFDDNYLIATREYNNAKYEPEIEFREFTYEKNINERKLLDGNVFNCGVLLFNLDKLRHDNIDIEFYNKKLRDKKIKLADQSILNYCFYDKVKYLTTCKYNYRVSFSIPDYFNGNLRHKYGLNKYSFYPIDAKILHYTGYLGLKPWYFKFEESDVPNASKAFLQFVPQLVPLYNIWWKYAALLPEDKYNQLKVPAEQNAAIYRMLYMCVNKRPYTFHNALQIEPLSAPAWGGHNNVNANSTLNDYIVPLVFICDANTKTTIKNLPEDFKENVSFRLTVKQLAGKPLLQELEADNDNATVWRRTSPDNGATWSKWNRLATVTDLQSVAVNNYDNSTNTFDDCSSDIDSLKKRVENLERINYSSVIKELEKSKVDLNIVQNDYIKIKKSVSFRIGCVVTWLPRKIRDLFKKK